ncbi:hypothetical protein [Dictyobacter aurantiacus]|uniref:Uncharacterized protein n=1 Tax=Dictyobacter aurantiacus TaxID=1936993 RepID=A0A401ZQT8_9CHLR|nr:hypothetical protein [Dictyobacter aurantiacus]GCE09144.1 hypothetical protein KDAU_64730 [Dictyobacter aurantiacus]
MITPNQSLEEKQLRHPDPRNASILTLVLQQRAIRIDQMMCFITACEGGSQGHRPFPSKSSIHNRIEHLQREGLLNLEQIEQGQPGWIWLTKKGVRMLGSTAPWKRPGRHVLPFLSASNAIRLLLTEQYPQATWRSRQQLKEAATKPRESLLPTAELLTDSGQRIAIHVMIRLVGTDEQVVMHICEQLAHNTDDGTPYYTALWYYASGKEEQRLRTARAIVAALTTQAIARKISIISSPFQPHQRWNHPHLAVQTHPCSGNDNACISMRKGEKP